MSDARQLCTFYVDNLYLGIESHWVQEFVRPQRMTQVPTAHPAICGIINLRGHVVTAFDLRKRLALRNHEHIDAAMNVIIHHEETLVSLLVDKIADVVKVEKEAFEPPPETLRGFTRQFIVGAYKLPNQLLLLLEPQKLLDIENNGPQESGGPGGMSYHA